MVKINYVMAAVVWFAAFCSLVMAAFAFRRQKSVRTARPFLFMLIACAFYAGGYGFELLSTDLPHIYAWIRVEYLGLAFLPPLFVWLALSFAGLEDRVRRWFFPAGFGLSLVTLLLVMTNEMHHLYYADIAVAADNPFPAVVLTRGPWYLVAVAYYVGANLAAIGLYAWRLFRYGAIERGRMALMLAASVLILLEFGLMVAGFLPYRLDAGPVVVIFDCAFMAFGIFRAGLFDIGPLARKLVFSAMGEGVVVTLPDYEVVDWNPALSGFFDGLTVDRLGRPLAAISPGLASLAESLPFKGSGEFAAPVLGGLRYYEVKKLLIAGRAERPLGVALILRDITEVKKHIAQLEDLASRDGLTGILNLRQWRFLADNELARNQRNAKGLALLMIDLDHFKRVNDEYGHAAGDQVLKECTRKLAALVRPSDPFGRLGGEEFGLLLPDTDPAVALHKAEQLRAAVAGMEIAIGGGAIRATLSIGLACVSPGDPALSLDALLQRADRALYRAKEAGRNRVERDRPA